MTLPNYSPSGRIMFGSVPWDNGYVNVRLYTSLDQQYNDIASMMTIYSDDYVYIGRNRQLKVSIEADRLYRCNYCAYRNESVTDGWIYCFVTDVEYVNDNTSLITLETDVFNTYLYGVDWEIPPCFIERQTVPDNDERYLLTAEPDFPLIYEIADQTHKWFLPGGYIVMTGAEPKKNEDIVDAILNPSGWYADPIKPNVYKGMANGCVFWWCPIDDVSTMHSDELENILNPLQSAGSVDSVVAIFTVPQFMNMGQTPGPANKESSRPDKTNAYNETFELPERGNDVDGYVPRNRKLLYYPYNFCRLTDYNGSMSELRYEQLGRTTVGIKYAFSPQCQAIVVPLDYMGILNFDCGLVVSCGAQGSWVNDSYTTWLAQNSGGIMSLLGAAAIGGAGGIASFAKQAKLLGEADTLRNAGYSAFAGMAEADAAMMRKKGKAAMTAMGGALGMLTGETVNAMHQPTTTKGQANYNVQFATGCQGVHGQRVCCKAENAEQIDKFFDRFGYALERIDSVSITSLNAWNYVKTVGSAPRSRNAAPSATAPFTRGRGTPADALAVISSAFDNGVTFWHTTGGFGDYSQANK